MLPSSIVSSLGRSGSEHTDESIPRTTNELQKKLKDHLPMVPILRVFKAGRFPSSNSPAKSQKLHSAILIDSSCSQFVMWKERAELFSFPSASSEFPSISGSFTRVNEFFPIFSLFSKLSPLILKKFTKPKQSSPISKDWSWVNCEKSNFTNSESLQVQSGIVIEVTEDSIDSISLIV